MDGVISMDEARALVADAALWPRVRDFLWDFAPQVHESWIAGLEGSQSPAFSAARESPRCKAYVLSSLGVEPCFHAFPKEDWSRLLLLDGKTLLEIAKWLGSLVCADSLRRVTDGAKVRELKTGLSGAYPEVFGFTMYFGGLEAKDATCAKDVLEVGLGILFGRLAAVPEALVARAKFKLPKSLCDLCVSCNGEELPGAVLEKLLKLRFPEAYSLCC